MVVSIQPAGTNRHAPARRGLKNNAKRTKTGPIDYTIDRLLIRIACSSSRKALGDGGVIRLPCAAAQLREDRGQQLSYCLLESDRNPLPALQLELAPETLLLLTAKPLRVPTAELGEKGATLRAHDAEGAQTHWGEVQALVVANGKVLAALLLLRTFELDFTWIPLTRRRQRMPNGEVNCQVPSRVPFHI